MTKKANLMFPSVKDISEWQRLCSPYRFHDQEDYKLDWWLSVIETICQSNDSVLFNISIIKDLVQEEFRQWPIEVLCLHDIFRGLMIKKKITTLRSVIDHMNKVWDNELEVQKLKFENNISNIGFGWIRSFVKRFYTKKISYNFFEEAKSSFNDKELFLSSTVIEKLSKKIFEDLIQGILGAITKTSSGDEILVPKSNFDDYLVKSLDYIKDISISNISDIFLWYFLTFYPDNWIVKPFVVISTGGNSRINAIKFSKRYINNKNKEIEITESDIADIVLQIAEQDLHRSISSLEEKYLFHDSKCREYVLNDQKQLAINHLKTKKQIEKALNEVNEQLLILSQSRVNLDTSSTKVSLLNALESSSKITRNILNEAEISKKLEDISQAREEVEIAQESINSLIKSSVEDDSQEKLSSELEKELDELLKKVKITNLSSEQNLESSTRNSLVCEAARKNDLFIPIKN